MPLGLLSQGACGGPVRASTLTHSHRSQPLLAHSEQERTRPNTALERSLLMPFTPDLLFHETLSGPMALGRRESEHRARHGRTTRLSLHATIRIDSLED